MPAEALAPDEAERVVAALELMLARMEHRQVRVAAELGVSQQHISRLLRRKAGGPGPDLARRVARYFGVSAEDLRQGRVVLSVDHVPPRFADQPHWPDLVRDVQARLPTIPAGALRAVGDIRHPHPPTLTTDFVASLAIAWASVEPR